MPKNGAKTGKSSKTARVLSLLTDPAASLLRGGSHNHTDEEAENATELIPEPSSEAPRPGLDDAATESRIQASLAAEEDSLIENLFGKKETPRRRGAVRRESDAAAANAAPVQLPDISAPDVQQYAAPAEQPPYAQPAPQYAEPTQQPPVQPYAQPQPAQPYAQSAPQYAEAPAQPAQQYAEAPAPQPPVQQYAQPQPTQQYAQPAQQYAEAPAPQEPDPQTLELLSSLSNPSTLGNATFAPELETQPVTAPDDFGQLVAGMPGQPEPEPYTGPSLYDEELELMSPTRPQPYAQPAQPYAPQPTQQYAQPAPQYVEPAQQPYAQPAQPYATQSAQQYAAQPVQPAPVQRNAPPEKEEQEYICFNLTQALVEDKADKLMKQFGMCTCNRCKVDVTAIALSNLPAKYVAMQNRDILPLLSMYEEKYSAAVTVQVMSACRMVMNRPHHKR